MSRVLVTGPVERIGEWCRAARAAGWDAVEFPLLDVVARDVDPREALGEQPEFEWICLTSANALPFVERALAQFPALGGAAFACVGETTSMRLSDLGHSTAFDASRSAQQLAALVAARARSGARVLWPRGDRSNELAVELRAQNLTVVDPVVYSTVLREQTAPTSFDAVLFASPSAVRAWQDLNLGAPTTRATAIAIGPTTLSALLAETDLGFFDSLSLPEPDPETFGFVLQHLDPHRNP